MLGKRIPKYVREARHAASLRMEKLLPNHPEDWYIDTPISPAGNGSGYWVGIRLYVRKPRKRKSGARKA